MPMLSSSKEVNNICVLNTYIMLLLMSLNTLGYASNIKATLSV